MLDNKYVLQNIIRGIEEANRKYRKISGGYWLYFAPEYFLTSYLAEYIYDGLPPNCFVWLEESLWNEDIPLNRGRPPDALRLDGRADLAIYSEESGVCGIVEIKKTRNMELIASDLQRLKHMLISSKNQIPGFFGLYTDQNAKTKGNAVNSLQKFHDKLLKEVKENEARGTISQTLHSISDEEYIDGEYHAALAFASVYTPNEKMSTG